MFDLLSRTFSTILSSFSAEKTITPENSARCMETIKDALLQADVPYAVVQAFVDSLSVEFMGHELGKTVRPDEFLAKLVRDKLIAFLGGQSDAEPTFQIPSVIMVMGLQGSGKTTSVAKLAQYVCKQAQKRGKKRRVLVASVDFYRPAAIDQLEQLAGGIGVDCYRARATDAVGAAQEVYAYFKQHQYELLFLDTAGRLHVDEPMLQELKKIDAALQPKYKVLVLDAMTGQESLNVAQSFDHAVGFHGALLTKMDSDTRGGAAFAFRYMLKKPIMFAGIGEKVDDLSVFHPERVAGRMIGMGDLQTLAERAEEKIKDQEKQRMEQSFARGTLTLQDFADQMNMVNRMGSLSGLMKYVPGMAGVNISEADMAKGEKEMKKFRAIIGSMTFKERVYPRLLDGSRKKRVARGAGVSVQEVDMLLERFQQAQQYVKLFKKSGLFKNMFR